MKAPLRCLSSTAFALAFWVTGQAAVLTFEEFSPPNNDFINLFPDTPYGGVTFTFASVANDQLVANSQHASDYWETDGTGPFATPHSGHVALFNSFELEFATEQILTGVWVARPNLGPTGIGGTDHLTLTAYASNTALASLSIDLSSTTPVFWDASSFLLLAGITRYTIVPAQPGNATGYFIADDFQFASKSLADVCPCDGPWQSDRKYVRCVRSVLRDLRAENALSRPQSRRLLKAAIKSDCGRK